MVIKCKKSTLRPWTMDDVNSLAFYANNPKIAENLRDVFPNPYELKDAAFFIKNIASNKNHLILAIEIDKQAVGAIGIHTQTDIYRLNAELGYWLGEQFWGRGIVTDAVNTLVAYTFQHYDIQRIFAGVFDRNIASIKVLEKCGFTREAVLRKAIIKNNIMLDEHLYVRLKS